MGPILRVILLGAACCGLVLATGVSVVEAQAITFTVSNKTLHRIDPRLFGQFMERPSWGEIGVEGALVPHFTSSTTMQPFCS